MLHVPELVATNGRTLACPVDPFAARMSALELRDVVVDYERRGGGRVRAVAGASISVERGQIVGLVGESGCGKSTLARAAVGLVRRTSGSVVFEGREIVPLARRGRPRELARLQLVFQNPYASLNPRRKVGSQLADALETLDLVPVDGTAGSRPRSCASWSVCRRPRRIGFRTSSRAASGSASRSPAPSQPTRP